MTRSNTSADCKNTSQISNAEFWLAHDNLHPELKGLSAIVDEFSFTALGIDEIMRHYPRKQIAEMTYTTFRDEAEKAYGPEYLEHVWMPGVGRVLRNKLQDWVNERSQDHDQSL